MDTLTQKIVQKTGLVLIVASLIVIAVVAKNLLAPLVVAMVITYLVLSILDSFTDIRFGQYTIPRWLAIIFSLLTVLGTIWIITFLLSYEIQRFIEILPTYDARLNEISNYIFDLLERIGGPASQADLLASPAITRFAGSLTSLVTKAGAYGILTMVYVILMLAESRSMKNKITRFFQQSGRAKKVHTILTTISKQSGVYIRLKTLSSLIIGILTWLVLSLFGVEAPILWALLIFLFNYIPNVGPIVAIIFPTLLAMIQFGRPGMVVAIVLILIFVQLFVSNIVEPKMAGSSLNLSPLAIVIALITSGFIWGIVGMIIAVPCLLAFRISFDQFPETKGFALLMSGKITEK